MIETILHGDVLEIVLCNPPVNALSAAVRRQLAQAIVDARENAAVKAIVVRGAGNHFSAGADLEEFDDEPLHPHLPEIWDLIESADKPVVAALHGSVMGAGLEAALACHYRVSTPTARLVSPEVTMGLIPAGGGTQRLPRLIGVEAALNLIVIGTPVSGEQAVDLGLVDHLVSEQNLAAEAIVFARTAQGPRRTGLRSVVAEDVTFAAFAQTNARRIGNLEAPRAAIEAIRAARDLPFNEGLDKEWELFGQLVAGEQSKGLLHAFCAESKTARIEGLPVEPPLRPIKRIGVIGAGTMGGGISMNFLSAGIPVTIVEMTQDALDRGVAVVRKNYDATAAKGRLTSNEVDSAMKLLKPTLDFNALADCDLVIEAVYENLEVKKDIFARLDRIAKSGALLASNTSFLSIDEMAAVTARPQDVLGLHFFSPANVMKLVEVVRGAKTAPDALATGMALAKKIAKVPVVTGVCYGFIGNRMLIPRHANAYALLVEGATPDQVDQVHTKFGMPMGPFQMIDLAGVDIGWHRDPERVETIQEALCSHVRWGQKTKAGFYDYDDKRKHRPSAFVDTIIADFRARAGIAPRAISDEEITVRTLYSMVNEGAKILEEGIAQRASDIDVVWLCGYGWPRHTGGPMFWAGRIGLGTVVEGLEKYRHRLGVDFEFSSLLLERAKAGRSFED